MKKKILTLILTLILCCVSTFAFSGCSLTQNKATLSVVPSQEAYITVPEEKYKIPTNNEDCLDEWKLTFTPNGSTYTYYEYDETTKTNVKHVDEYPSFTTVTWKTLKDDPKTIETNNSNGDKAAMDTYCDAMGNPGAKMFGYNPKAKAGDTGEIYFVLWGVKSNVIKVTYE